MAPAQPAGLDLTLDEPLVEELRAHLCLARRRAASHHRGCVERERPRPVAASNHRSRPSLFLNMRNGTFVDTAMQVLPWRNRQNADTHGATWADYDNDGYQDVLIGNLDGAGGLYRNNGDLSFTLITGNGLDAANYFSAAWGDYNNDGNIDLFCGISGGNALYKNNGDGTFTKDLSTSITEANVAISASWGDFNNDGFLDLFTAGFASTQSRLFIRDASNPSTVVFKRIITEKINDRSVSHYSVAGADPDRNGLIDLALSAFVFDDDNGDALIPTNNNLYQNNNLPGNWSQVKLVPVTGNSEAGSSPSLASARV